VIQLNYRDSKPIYEQIKDGLKKLIITDFLQPNEKLPSVRELASGLAINPNTIQRAYRELESDGFIYSIAGKGSFVAEQEDARHTNERQQELLEEFDEVVEELHFLSMDEETLVTRLHNDYAGRKLKEGEQVI
jgi:GntR family transcriptional regulator